MLKNDDGLAKGQQCKSQKLTTAQQWACPCVNLDLQTSFPYSALYIVKIYTGKTLLPKMGVPSVNFKHFDFFVRKIESWKQEQLNLFVGIFT